MSSYQEQLARCKDTNDDYSNIWKSSVWTINDYEELFKNLSYGYIIQDPDFAYFIINPDWEEEEEEEEVKAVAHICDNPSCDVVLENDYWEAFKDDGKVMCCSGCEEDEEEEVVSNYEANRAGQS